MLNYPVCYYDPNELSPREEEIKNLICKGKRIKEIANELKIKPTTVATHLRRIAIKKDTHSQRELMAQRIKELEDKLDELVTRADKS